MKNIKNLKNNIKNILFIILIVFLLVPFIFYLFNYKFSYRENFISNDKIEIKLGDKMLQPETILNTDIKKFVYPIKIRAPEDINLIVLQFANDINVSNKPFSYRTKNGERVNSYKLTRNILSKTKTYKHILTPAAEAYISNTKDHKLLIENSKITYVNKNGLKTNNELKLFINLDADTNEVPILDVSSSYIQTTNDTYSVNNNFGNVITTFTDEEELNKANQQPIDIDIHENKKVIFKQFVNNENNKNIIKVKLNDDIKITTAKLHFLNDLPINNSDSTMARITENLSKLNWIGQPYQNTILLRSNTPISSEDAGENGFIDMFEFNNDGSLNLLLKATDVTNSEAQEIESVFPSSSSTQKNIDQLNEDLNKSLQDQSKQLNTIEELLYMLRNISNNTNSVVYPDSDIVAYNN